MHSRLNAQAALQCFIQMTNCHCGHDRLHFAINECKLSVDKKLGKALATHSR
jgi:hypothetical protein